MKKWKAGISAALSAVVLTVSFAGCGNVKNTQTVEAASGGKDTVTIGYLPITHALTVFETKELLDEKDQGVQIELQKFSSWTDLMDALNAGQIDGASVLAELAMNAASQGIDLKAIDLGHRDGNVIVVSDEIQSVEDIKGKTIAIPSNQSSHYLLLNDALDKAGLTTEDITITQLAPSEMPSSLASHSIDGYCVAEPFGAQAVVQGYGHVLYQSEELWPDSICCAFVLRNDYIEAHTDEVETLRKQYEEAGAALDEDTAVTIAQKYLGQDEETLTESLKWIQFDQLEITEEDYKTLTEKMVAYGVNENPPSYKTFVYQAADSTKEQ